MLTPEAIRSIEFQRSGFGGYKATDVDDFIEQVATSFEQILRQNNELIEKIQVLADHIEEYRTSEDAVKTAIINAQKTASSIMEKAEKEVEEYRTKNIAEADSALKKARDEANKLVNDAKTQAEAILDETALRSKSILAKTEEDAKAANALVRKKLGQQLGVYNKIKDEVCSFKNDIIDSYQKQIELLSSVACSEEIIEQYEEKLDITDSDDRLKNEPQNENAAAEQAVPENNTVNDTTDDSAEEQKIILPDGFQE